MHANPYVEALAALATRQALASEPRKQETQMPKILKKFEHKEPERATGRKYDWDLILGGQNVQLDAGADYDAEGTNKKTGEAFDRTDDFAASIKTRASDEGKVASVTKIGADGKPLADAAAKAHGLVVTARKMTAEELAARDARRAAAKANREAKGANGQAAHGEPLPQAEAPVAPE